jgi:chromate transporter
MEQVARATDAPTQRSVSFWEAFRFWLKLGFINLGGPAGQIAIMHWALVDERRWSGTRLHRISGAGALRPA